MLVFVCCSFHHHGPSCCPVIVPGAEGPLPGNPHQGLHQLVNWTHYPDHGSQQDVAACVECVLVNNNEVFTIDLTTTGSGGVVSLFGGDSHSTIGSFGIVFLDTSTSWYLTSQAQKMANLTCCRATSLPCLTSLLLISSCLRAV